MKVQYLLSVFLLLSAFACKDSGREKTPCQLISIELAEIIPIENLIEGIKVIPLELTPQSILPPRGRMWPGDGCFLYSGRIDGAEQVFQFDEAGTYLRRIGKPGAGPGEYRSCYNLIDLGDTLAIYDQSKKFSFYLKETGSFVGQIDLTGRMINAASIHPNNRDVYLLTGSRDYQVYRLNRCTLSEKDSFLRSTVNYESMNNSFYPTQSGDLIYQNRDDLNLIFYDIKDLVKKKFRLMTGTDMSHYKLEDFRSIQNIKASGQKIWMVRGILENSDWIYLYLRYDIWSPERTFDMMHFLIQKSTEKVYCLPGNRTNEDTFGRGFRLDSNNCLYVTYNPEQMDGNQLWQSRLKELGVRFDLQQNPFVVVLDLDKVN